MLAKLQWLDLKVHVADRSCTKAPRVSGPALSRARVLVRLLCITKSKRTASAWTHDVYFSRFPFDSLLVPGSCVKARRTNFKTNEIPPVNASCATCVICPLPAYQNNELRAWLFWTRPGEEIWAMMLWYTFFLLPQKPANVRCEGMHDNYECFLQQILWEHMTIFSQTHGDFWQTERFCYEIAVSAWKNCPAPNT